MGNNRKYTGLERTPASMAWLIEQRSALKGKINQARRQLARAERTLQDVPRQLVDLEAQLASLDAVFSLHEVCVEPQQIRGKRPYNKAVLPYGVLSKSILKILREADRPLLTSTIATRIMLSVGEEMGWAKATILRRRTSARLKRLASLGIVDKHHAVGSGAHGEGLWSLARDEEDEADGRERRVA